jgi:hypothetical protein
MLTSIGYLTNVANRCFWDALFPWPAEGGASGFARAGCRELVQQKLFQGSEAVTPETHLRCVRGNPPTTEKGAESW